MSKIEQTRLSTLPNLPTMSCCLSRPWISCHSEVKLLSQALDITGPNWNVTQFQGVGCCFSRLLPVDSNISHQIWFQRWPQWPARPWLQGGTCREPAKLGIEMDVSNTCLSTIHVVDIVRSMECQWTRLWEEYCIWLGWAAFGGKIRYLEIGLLSFHDHFMTFLNSFCCMEHVPPWPRKFVWREGGQGRIQTII